MDEDGDVVREGSALYEHLKSTGLSEFETTNCCPNAIVNPLVDSVNDRNLCSISKNFPQYCKEKLRNLSFSPLRKDEDLGELQKSTLSSVLQGRLLNEDDLRIVEHFVPVSPEFLTSLKKCNRSKPKKCFPCVLKHPAILGCFGVLLAHIFSHRLYISLWNPLYGFSTCLVLLLMQVAVFIIIVRYVYLHDVIAKIEDIERRITGLGKVSQLMNNALRQLQEMNLVMKGFALSAKGPVHTMTILPANYQHLQSALTDAAVTLSSLLYDWQLRLGEHGVQYPGVKLMFPRRGEGVPDLDLKGLKEMVSLIKLQISSVLTMFVLALYNGTAYAAIQELMSSDTFEASDYSNPDYSDSSVFGKRLEDLERSLAYVTADPIDDDVSDIMESRKDESEARKVSLHKLSLHVQASLWKIRRLENLLETDRSLLLESEGWLEAISAIRLEMDLSVGSLEELEEHESIPPLKEHHNVTGCIDISRETEKLEKVTLDTKERVIEDEVYEAFVDHEIKFETSESYDNMEAVVKLKLMKQQKEEVKRVLRELGPILKDRRMVWEKREEKALRKGKDNGDDSFDINDKMKTKREELDESGTEVSEDELKNGSAFKEIKEDYDSVEEQLIRYRRVLAELNEDESRREEYHLGLQCGKGNGVILLPEVKREKEEIKCSHDISNDEDNVNGHQNEDSSNMGMSVPAEIISNAVVNIPILKEKSKARKTIEYTSEYVSMQDEISHTVEISSSECGHKQLLWSGGISGLAAAAIAASGFSGMSEETFGGVGENEVESMIESEEQIIN